MSNIAANHFLYLRKQSYAVVAKSVRIQVAKSNVEVVKANVGSESTSVGNRDGKIFWMKDPKTGNWIPENHFGEVDAADLRNKFLPKRSQNQ
ncbi:uncharacterized protein LOC131618223 [Vicia villosa]|uniref:uncharacterized protein LOC131618223 n=1 Tax=Vicia villosa TaxID=3911 RepID=UPI00273C7CE5|nr:uncharacterized protein LOC131618223 [Vicia villosa]